MTTTTLTTLQSDAGVAFDYVVAVEGYGYLLTSGPPADAVTAWSGTDWSAAIGGLAVTAKMGQKLDPWRPFGEASELTFSVIPCPGQAAGTDRFGEDVWNRTGGTASDLAANVDCDDTTVTVLRADDFASSGTIYLENEALAYSARNTGTDVFTISTRGKYSPFTTESGGRFAHPHRLTDTATDAGGVTVPPTATSFPRTWIGRWVAVYMHRRLGATLDVVAQAHLAWAGRIVALEETESGATVVTCEDVRASINNALLLRNQYTARVKEGIYLPAGTKFQAATSRQASGTTSDATLNELVVVESGASGANQLNAGIYTVQAIATYLCIWFASEKSAARSLFNLTYNAAVPVDDGMRGQLRLSDPTGGSALRTVALRVTNRTVAKGLGWSGDRIEIVNSSSSEASAFGASAPVRVKLVHGQATGTLYVENERGTWIDQGDLLPGDMTWDGTYEGVLQLSDKGRIVAKRTGTGQFTYFVPVGPNRTGQNFDTADERMAVSLSVEEEGDLTLSQVIVAQAPFKTLLRQILSSTGTAAFNNSYDLLGEGLGCGIPHALIDTLVDADLANVDAADQDLTVVIDKATKFADVFAADFIIRKSFLVWNAGQMRLTAWATPTSAYASVALTEANKAAPIGNVDRMRASAQETDDWMRNVVKIQYGRRADGTYETTLNLEDASSVRTYGAKPITIELRNIPSGIAAFVASTLVGSFGEWLPVLSRPVVRVRRTLARTLFETAIAGAQATVTDRHIRDWATGQRGITGRPAIVVGHWYDWGGAEHGEDGPPRVRPPSGEVDLLMYPTSTAAYAPAALVDDTATNGGYVDATKTLTCYAHKYSESSETADPARFVTNDKVRIIEVDPADPAAPDTWLRQVASQTGNTIVLTSALSSPSWTSTKKYRVVPDSYANCQATQQTKCYQADSADGLIADTRAAYEYSQFTGGQATSYTGASASDLPARYAQAAYGDAVPLDVGYEDDLAKLANNLPAYRTAPQCPRVYSEDRTWTAGGTWLMVQCSYIYVGPFSGLSPNGTTRKLYLAPRLKVSSGTGSVRVTLLRGAPYGTSLYDATLPDPKQSVTFTTTSATYEVATTQGIDISHLVSTLGVGFLVVEINANTTFDGFAMHYLGPYEGNTAWQLVQPRRDARNGMYPVTGFVGKSVQIENELTSWRHKEVFRWEGRLGAVVGSAGTVNHSRWHFHTGYGVTRLVAYAVLAKPNTAGTDPYVRIAVTSGGTTTFDPDMHTSGTAAGSITDAPSEWIYARSECAVTANTTYTGLVTAFDYARILSITVYEVNDAPLDEATSYYNEQNPQAGAKIYASHRQRLLQGMSNMWIANGALLCHWGRDGGSARTRTSATQINLIDNTTTGTPTTSSPGWKLQLAARTTVSQTIVRCTFAVYASMSSGSGTVKLVDTSGTVVATITVNSATPQWWTATTTDLAASNGKKYDPTFAGDGSNTISVYFASLYEYHP